MSICLHFQRGQSVAVLHRGKWARGTVVGRTWFVVSVDVRGTLVRVPADEVVKRVRLVSVVRCDEQIGRQAS
jgi:hypothetical protein